MHESIRIALEHLVEGESLSADAMRAAIAAIMDGEAGEVEIAALLTALRTKGESIDEIAGAAQAMRERASKIPTRRSGLVDTCGTGGDKLSTFNISTAAAIVAAAAGAPVAKHGNRSVSSSSGSADVLEALGVNIQLGPRDVGRCIDEVGIGFCFAPLCHGAMQHALPVRRQLKFRTIFNLLGPLTNPAGADYQLVGANSAATAAKLAGALARLSRKRAIVVCGDGGLDEVSLWGETVVLTVSGGSVAESRWTSATFGLPECNVESLRVTSAAESAEVIRSILRGQHGPARDIVLANAAAALIAAGRETAPAIAVAKAAEAIESGRAADVCLKLVEMTSRDPLT